MLLAIDIGNTNTNFGLFRGSRLTKKFSFPTKACRPGQLRKKLRGSPVTGVIVSSVVPEATTELKRTLRALGMRKPRILGQDAFVPVKNRYRKPAQVGQDRLVNAFAAIRLYGAPAVIVDFGTAITFDVVSRNREYLGGIIVPGIRISLDALAGQTALLPKIRPNKPRELIGKDTRSSILSGAVFGFSALADRLIERIRGSLGQKMRVIATGGDAGLIAPYCRNFQVVDPDLTLKGLCLTNLFFCGKLPLATERRAP